MTFGATVPAFVVRWSDLGGWDIKAAAVAALKVRHHSFQPFGDFIEEWTEFVRPNLEPDKTWPVYGVSNQVGAFLSSRQRGSDFQSPYKRIEKDWFFHNPTRANVGSFARVPDVEKDSVTSPEYQVWRLTAPDWSPDFVEILLQLPFFMEQVQVHRVGAVKQRLYVENLRRILVPVLDSASQQEVVRDWCKSAEREAALRREAAEREREVASAFMAALGLAAPGEIERRRAFSVRWSHMGRWAVAANHARTGGKLEDGHYPLKALSELVADLENGWSPKCLARPAQEGEWGVLKVGAVSSGRYDHRENKALPLNLDPQPRLEVQEGDFLIGRANITRLVGSCALVEETPRQLMLSDKIFRARWLQDTHVEPAYLDAALKLPHLRAVIEAAATGTSPTMKNISKPALMALPIPCPPLAEQRRLANMVRDEREIVAKKLKVADTEQRERISKTEQKVLELAN